MSAAKPLVKVLRLPAFMMLACLCLAGNAYTQQKNEPIPDGTEGEFFHSLDSSFKIKKQKNWNEFNLHFTTLRFGAGLLYDYVTYAQDNESKQQADSGNYSLTPMFKVRDFRVLLSGKFNTKRYENRDKVFST